MSKETDWFTAMSDHRVTVTEIAGYLGVSRRTATNRVNDGLSADELINISRKLDISPIHALVELEKISLQEALDFVDKDGRLLETAAPDELLYQLAKDSLPISLLLDLGNDARDRVARQEELHKGSVAPLRVVSDSPDTLPSGEDGTVREFDYSEHDYAADSSPNEQEEREERGEDLID